MAFVTIRNLKKAYGSQPVLHDVSLDAENGEFIVLVGPSGCGKSTLLRLIAGLEEDHEGSISLGERRIDKLPPRDRDIAMVFQNYALYPHLTVRDNLGFPLRLRGVRKAEADNRVRIAAEQLGLSLLMDRYPRELSGGQRQRVAMGRAIVRDPKLFLFDEPLSNLDAKLRVQMRTEIKSLHTRLGATSVYVTHDQIEAMTMADRIVVMNEGDIVQIGTPLELYDNPASLFVAGFIGSPNMNFIEAEAHSPQSGLTAAGGVTLPLHAIDRGRLHKAVGRVVYGIRPEHLGFTDDPQIGVPAQVRAIEPTGAETHVQLDVAGASWVAVTKSRPSLKIGETLLVAPQKDAVHLFDAANGRRIAA